MTVDCLFNQMRTEINQSALMADSHTRQPIHDRKEKKSFRPKSHE